MKTVPQSLLQFAVKLADHDDDNNQCNDQQHRHQRQYDVEIKLVILCSICQLTNKKLCYR